MADWLHRGDDDSGFRNLGLWTGIDRYSEAGRALALAVGQAAALQRGHSVLSMACGAGAELRLWRQHFHAAAVLGIDRDPAAVARAQSQVAGDPACRVRARVLPTDRDFDAVLCVDAAYHLQPRARWLQQAHAQLRPGGHLAFADLVLRRGSSPLLRGAAALCGVGDLTDTAQRLRQLHEAGFVDARAQDLDDAVLGGFARFVARHRRGAGRSHWRGGRVRAQVTAALIGPCRRAGLGYVLFTAQRST